MDTEREIANSVKEIANAVKEIANAVKENPCLPLSGGEKYSCSSCCIIVAIVLCLYLCYLLVMYLLPILSNPGSSPMHRETEVAKENANKGRNASAVLKALSRNLFRVMRVLPDKKDEVSLSSGKGVGEIFPVSIGEEVAKENENKGRNASAVLKALFRNLFRVMRVLPDKKDEIPLSSNETKRRNESAVAKALPPNLFRVMHIVPDKQDCSLVEKLQLPEDEILSLCNKLVHSSASAYLGNPPRVRINFNALNQNCLPAIGFYGDKQMMIRIFRQESLVDESVLAKMEGRLFEPGFYVSLPQNAATVVVFYWHEGEHFSEASREDASSNFIRYLVELCGSVYICVEGNYPFEALAASATKERSKAKEAVPLQQVSQNKAPEVEREETELVGSCPYLGDLYHIFDKFATTPALFPDHKKCITFKVVLESSRLDPSNACIKYLKALIRQIKASKDKYFSNMKIHFHVNNVENCLVSVAAEEQTPVKMGIWVRKLLCLVPIQIARAENNAVVALKDGLQIPPDIGDVDSVSLANSIRFGLYDAVLNSWKGKIKVISSMGKQSSGKSYLLNHLSGSLLDVPGGSDGVWMTITTGEDGDEHEKSRYLYVLLDFEGFGSFERSEQEDTLLSVLNAAVSNLTIFNKKDFHLDKDTEYAFSRFQSGIDLFKPDKKLFKGLFYIAINNVDTSVVEDLMQEFQIYSKSQDNFILKMFGGKFKIAAMAPYNRSDSYRESLSELAGTVKYRIDSCYDNGSTFLRDLKLIIAQIAAKDWTSIDSKRVAVIVDILRRNLMSAVHMGCLSANANEDMQVFINFYTEEEVLDFPVGVGDLSCDIKDSGLYLIPSKDSSNSVTIRDVLTQIRSRLEMVLARKGINLEVWHSMFENFLKALAERRHARVQQWISANTIDFRDNDEVQRLQLEANVALGEVKQGLSVCGCKCSGCFWRCVLEKGHRDDHSCMGSHSCAESCGYCALEGKSLNACGDLAGHEGFHMCKGRNHTCGEACHLFEISSNCNKLCSMRPAHPGQHKCNSPQHVCIKKCSFASCNNPCALAIKSNHTDAEHLCGNEHACPNECEMPGICEKLSELVRRTQVFQGQRGTFEYERVSEQNGRRKGCCIPIPPFGRHHQDPHVHTKNTDSVHYCDSRCQSCGNFCQLPIHHSGLHNTMHGNMRNVKFVSESEDIEIQDRKYKWGERGDAEVCHLYCKKQGRGHIHLVPCRDSKCTSNLYDGSRHETVKYGPDVDIPKDEMNHDAFWEYVGYVDPCTEEERKEFGLCNHYCKSEEHETQTGGSHKSYCTGKLLHPPIKSSGQNLSSAGYITDDGHHFSCDHSKKVSYHVIFVIDISGSMDRKDMSPTLTKFIQKHDNRLGSVYEAILKFIHARLRTVSDDSVSVVLFNTRATVAVEMEDMKEDVVDRLLQYYPRAGTIYSEGLNAAKEILVKGAQHQIVKVKKPVVIFLSDGIDNGKDNPSDCVEKMMKQEPRLVLHTLMFGNDRTTHYLIEMANKGGGKFQQTLNEIQLAESFEKMAKSFENLAESLKPQVTALM